MLEPSSHSRLLPKPWSGPFSVTHGQPQPDLLLTCCVFSSFRWKPTHEHHQPHLSSWPCGLEVSTSHSCSLFPGSRLRLALGKNRVHSSSPSVTLSLGSVLVLDQSPCIGWIPKLVHKDVETIDSFRLNLSSKWGSRSQSTTSKQKALLKGAPLRTT